MEAELITALIGLITVVTVLLRNYITTKSTPQRLAVIADLARQVVVGVDQDAAGRPPTLGGLDVTLTGEEKYSLAADALTSLAKRLGIKLDEDEVSAFIHAALADIQQGVKLMDQARYEAGYTQALTDAQTEWTQLTSARDAVNLGIHVEPTIPHEDTP